MEPKVSICIPIYNAEKFIHETIASVLSQTYQDFEIVITDNCSTDGSAAIIQSFNDPRIRYVKNDSNIGAEGNWNKVLTLANGSYVKLLCADDVIYPSCLEEQVAVLDNPQNANVVLVTSHKDVINQDGKLVMTRKYPGKKGHINGLAALRKSLRRGTNILGEPVAGLFRKEILQKSGYYNGDNLYMIDIDLWSRMLKFGDLYVIDKVLYAFRISTQSLSTNIGFGQVKLFNTFVDKLFADKSFNISIFDKAMAKTMALAMGIARNMIYVIYFRKK